LWLIAAIAVVLVSAGFVLLHWKTYSLPIRLLPVDILTVVLLIDLNIKSSSNVTLADPLMKVEAIAFTGLLAFILFAPILWKLAFDRESAPLT
jgi:hypothetical protein